MIHRLPAGRSPLTRTAMVLVAGLVLGLGLVAGSVHPSLAQTGSGTGAGRTEIPVSAEGETTLRYWRDDPRDAQSLTIRIDRTRPTITVDAPLEGARYRVGEVPASAFTCADAHSGVVSCAASTPAGERLPAEPGAHVFEVQATDAAGHRAAVTIAYTVAAPAAGGGSGGGPQQADRPSPAPAADARRGLAVTGADMPLALGAFAVFTLLAGVALLACRRVQR